MKKQDEMDLVERLLNPTPKFFKKIGRLGYVLAGIGTAIIAAPVALPAGLVTIGGYLLTAGLVTKAVASTTVELPEPKEPEKE